MVSSLRLRGTYVPVVTPFDEHGAVSLDALERLVADCLAAGATGIVALATTGEPSSLDDDERAAVLALCGRVCSDLGGQLLVGAGTNDTRTTIARHEALADVPGVTASLAVTPYYVRPAEPAVVAHLQLVAERSPVPVVAYNVPYRTGRGLGAAALLELAATPDVAGLKQAVGAVDADTLTVLAGAPDGFAVLGGDDPYLFPLVLMGATGAIAASANLQTRRFVAMVEDGLAGRLAEGRAHAEALLPLTLALFAEPSPAVIKAVLHAEGRIPTPDVRMPLANASPGAVRAALAVRDGLYA
ncbi:dihydrodipicolinate synthase family protein [Modestobacter versicolor]|uniref:4-hydroxy-tetrahydrodipicolinate synthase n=1 Tax=Modestobacter versicolor TaxID=429133 RepID=A0A839YD07_9ACTN|nr:dihydrodipicolinate synthase family protein [Modestobacter versicolor]MBB3677633.1 4-hydroxy-tetrahydrodipicolinate synthase [Modestobacter versicolor]